MYAVYAYIRRHLTCELNLYYMNGFERDMRANHSLTEKAEEENNSYRTSKHSEARVSVPSARFPGDCSIASFLCRQTSLPVNVYLNESDPVLPVDNIQSFSEYAQGLFLDNFHPQARAFAREKQALRNAFDGVFAPFFASPGNPDGIEKPPICDNQIRAFNARQMFANFKVQVYTHFFKFQYGSTAPLKLKRGIVYLLISRLRAT